MKPIGFIEGFLETAILKPETPALELIDLIDEPAGERAQWSYGQLLALIERYRGCFLGLGVQPGEPVLLQLPSGPDLIACVYALASMKAVFAPVSPKLTSYELAAIVDDFQPAGVVSDGESARQWKELAAAKSQQTRFVLSPGALPKVSSPMEPPSGNPIVSCHYTYKGMGHPLGALHRYDDYGCCIRAIATTFHDAFHATHLVGLPVYPIYGLTTGVLAPLATGGRLLLTHRIFEAGLVEMLERHQAGFACMVPMLLKKLTLQARRLKERGHTFRLNPNLQIMSGGSYLDAETAAAVKAALGIDVYQGYGLTETLPVTGTYRGNDKPGSLGVPFSGEIKVAIVDSGGREVPAGAAGEIAVHSRTLMEGYRGKPAETAQFLRDGWFHTGDLGFKDADGFLHFIGRRCAITKVASQMADLVEVENAIRTVPAIAGVRVTVIVRSEIGECLAASVIVRDGAHITERELKLTCKRLLSPHKTPREFRICERRPEELCTKSVVIADS